MFDWQQLHPMALAQQNACPMMDFTPSLQRDQGEVAIGKEFDHLGVLEFDTLDFTSFRINNMNLEGALCDIYSKVNPTGIELCRVSVF